MPSSSDGPSPSGPKVTGALWISSDDGRDPVRSLPMHTDDLIPTEPDCPACGTRCHPHPRGFWCRFCDLIW